MQIVILSQYFFPELISTGQLLTELAEDLVDQGCSVTVIAGQPTYYERSVVQGEIIHKGIRIERSWNSQWDKNRVAGKIVNSTTFFLGVLRRILSTPRAATLLVVTNPPILPLAAYLLSALRPQKYVCLIHDVYPDIAVALGYLRREGVPAKVWNIINRYVLRKAEAIIVVGRDMEEIIRATSF